MVKAVEIDSLGVESGGFKTGLDLLIVGFDIGGEVQLCPGGTPNPIQLMLAGWKFKVLKRHV